MVAENNRATGLWAWLKGHGLRDVSRMQVLDIAWFTESMKAGRPVTMEIRHHIQVSGPECTMSVDTVRCVCVQHVFVHVCGRQACPGKRTVT